MNNTQVLIAPSILSGDFANFGESVASLGKWGADIVHCDIMDGVFVPNLTFGMPVVKSIKKYSDLPFDVHLMIVEPEKYIAQFIDAGADIITFHPEASQNVDLCIQTAKEKNVLVGLVLNPDIDENILLPYLDKIDLIEVMGVFAGFGGQKYIPATTEKLKRVKAMINKFNPKIILEVDGGVGLSNIKEIVDAGATMIVAGSAVYGAENPSDVIKQMKSC